MDTISASLTVSCRFVPYDQWLLTHVHSSWKVKDVKLWFLSRCISHPTLNALLEDADLDHFHREHNNAEHPPSPITFASSPIFAFDQPSDSDHANEELRDEVSSYSHQFLHKQREPKPAATPPPVIAKPKSRVLELTTDAVVAAISTASGLLEAKENVPKHPIPSAYDPQQLSLVRFSTGQVLEDEYSLEWYEVRSEEMFEIHRLGYMFRLPRHSIPLYIQPYWEGRVKALRVIFKHPRHPPNGDAQAQPQPQKVLEWRERWATIRDGILSIGKDARHADTPQLLPLDTLTALRGREHLRRSTSLTLHQQQRIICAKFSVKSTKPQPTQVQGEAAADQLYRHKGIMRQAYGNPYQADAISSSTTVVISASSPIATASSGNSSSSSKPHISLNIIKPPSKPFSRTAVPPSSKSKREKLKKAPKPTDTSSEEERISAPAPAAAPSSTKEEANTTTWNPATETLLDSVPPEGDNLSDSSALSSPVFAHGHVEKPGGNNTPSDNSDEEFQRPVYSYGYRGEVRRRKEASLSTDPEPAGTSRHKSSTPVKVKNKVRSRKTKEQGEWVVLDLTDEHAYTSMLRVLHRSFPDPISSTFTNVIPSMAMSSFPDSPPRRPGANSEHPAGLSHKHSKSTISSTNRTAVGSDSIHSPTPESPTSLHKPSPRSASHPRTLSNHPRSLGSITQHSTSTFGATPYPEWRLETATRARKAGIGEVGGAMETFLFGGLVKEKPSGQLASRGRSGRKDHNNDSAPNTARQSMVSQDDSIGINRFPVFDLQDSDLDEEISEREWLGWMGDIDRQVRSRESAKERLAEETQKQPKDDDDDSLEIFPKNSAEDQQQLHEARRALEPCGVVISLSAIPVPSSPLDSTAPASPIAVSHHSPTRALSSSSTDSLVRTRPVNFGPDSPLPSSAPHPYSPPFVPAHSASQSSSSSQPSASHFGAASRPGKEQQQWASLPRRASIAGIVPPTGGSVGRSSSVLARSSNLFWKKGAEPPVNSEEGPTGPGRQSMSGSAPTTNSIVRRVKSGSSLLQTSGDNATSSASGRQKRSIMRELAGFVEGK